MYQNVHVQKGDVWLKTTSKVCSEGPFLIRKIWDIVLHTLLRPSFVWVFIFPININISWWCFSFSSWGLSCFSQEISCFLHREPYKLNTRAYIPKPCSTELLILGTWSGLQGLPGTPSLAVWVRRGGPDLSHWAGSSTKPNQEDIWSGDSYFCRECPSWRLRRSTFL